MLQQSILLLVLHNVRCQLRPSYYGQHSTGSHQAFVRHFPARPQWARLARTGPAGAGPNSLVDDNSTPHFLLRDRERKAKIDEDSLAGTFGKLHPSVVNSLGSLPETIDRETGNLSQRSARNLSREWQLGDPMNRNVSVLKIGELRMQREKLKEATQNFTTSLVDGWRKNVDSFLQAREKVSSKIKAAGDNLSKTNIEDIDWGGDWGEQAKTYFVEYEKKALQLKSLEKMPEMAEEADFFNERLNSLREELQKLPMITQFLLFTVVWKMLRVVIAVLDETLQEIVMGRTLVTKIVFACISLPGILLIAYFWSAITENVGPQMSAHRNAGKAFAETGVFMESCRKLVQNCRRLPTVFWVGTAISSLIALQLIQGAVLTIMHFFSDNQMVQFLTLAACVASQSEDARRIVRSIIRRLGAIPFFARELMRDRTRGMLRSFIKALSSAASYTKQLERDLRELESYQDVADTNELAKKKTDKPQDLKDTSSSIKLKPLKP